MTDQPTCRLCGEPMPKGEESFVYHGYSGPCPKPALVPCKRTMFGHRCRESGDHGTHEIQFAADSGRQIVVTWREASATEADKEAT
jgi:hypothetical protein